MRMNYEEVKKNKIELRALTGHDQKEIEEELLPHFEQAFYRHEAKSKISGRHRQRRVGGGRKPILQTMMDKLFFILVYSKSYPIQSVMAVQFGLCQSQVNEWIHRLMPVLAETLEKGGHLPERDASQLETVVAQSPDMEVIIDGSERRRGRPVDPEQQRAYYSGRKKCHTFKNNIISEANGKRVLYLSPTYEGHHHDKKLADQEKYHFPEGTVLVKDTGFQGYEPVGVISLQPKKKAPKEERSLADRLLNRAISSLRVPVEHTLSGVKRMRIVKDLFRNTRNGFADLVMLVACGLHNLRVKTRYPNPFGEPIFTL